MDNFNFEGVLKDLILEENRICDESFSFLNSDFRLCAFIKLIDRSLRTIHELNYNFQTKNEDELTIQYLGCRVFNSASSGLKLGLQGYYQSGFSLIRDLIESGFLFDYFTIDPSQINVWRKADNKTRASEFSPFKIREKIDNRDGFKEGKRNKIYKRFCELASHASYQGFLLISQNGLVKIGPFFDANFLRALIEEIVIRLPIVVLYFLENFSNLPNELIEIRLEFLKELDEINSKFLGSSKNEKIQQIEELLEYAKEKKYL